MLFAAFTTVYFLLHIPVLAAADTVAGLQAGLVSLVCAFRLDRQSAGFILLRVLWLGLATYVAVFVALSNIMIQRTGAHAGPSPEFSARF